MTYEEQTPGPVAKKRRLPSRRNRPTLGSASRSRTCILDLGAYAPAVTFMEALAAGCYSAPRAEDLNAVVILHWMTEHRRRLYVAGHVDVDELSRVVPPGHGHDAVARAMARLATLGVVKDAGDGIWTFHRPQSTRLGRHGDREGLGRHWGRLDDTVVMDLVETLHGASDGSDRAFRVAVEIVRGIVSATGRA